MLLIDPIDDLNPLEADAHIDAREAGSQAAGSAGQGRDPRKKRVRVINRRGPSEIDKAVRMNQSMKEQSKGAGRKSPDKKLSRGTIIRIDKSKGFGFVIDSAGEHRFFHRSAVLEGGFGNLKEQQLVEFEPQSDERGARAVNVRPAGTASRSDKDKPASSPRPARSAPKAPAWRSDLSPFRNGTGSPSSPRKNW
jgi:cold shock protein